MGDRTGEMHRIGDRVEVKLVEAAPVAGALRFELLTEGSYVKGPRGGGPQRRGAPSGFAGRPGRSAPGRAKAGKAGSGKAGSGKAKPGPGRR